MLDDSRRNLDVLAIDLKPGPVGWPMVQYLENLLRCIPFRERKQDAPFHQVSIVRVPQVLCIGLSSNVRLERC